MNEQRQSIAVFLDSLSNLPKDDDTREYFRGILQDRFQERLDDSIERMWDLPSFIVEYHEEPLYLSLLIEARYLYVAGYFYSCVAMCGVVGERLAKDVLRTSLLIQKTNSIEHPSGSAFDQLERIDASNIVRFLKESGLLSAEAAKAARKLAELRNKYAHARGMASQDDAINSVKLLHSLVEDTVSIFKEYTIKDGIFVSKQNDDQS